MSFADQLREAANKSQPNVDNFENLIFSKLTQEIKSKGMNMAEMGLFGTRIDLSFSENQIPKKYRKVDINPRFKTIFKSKNEKELDEIISTVCHKLGVTLGEYRFYYDSWKNVYILLVNISW